MSGLDTRTATRLRAMAGLMKTRDLAALRAAATARGEIQDRLRALGRELAQARTDSRPGTIDMNDHAQTGSDRTAGDRNPAEAQADALTDAHSVDRLAALTALRRAELNVALAAATARWHDARSCAARAIGREFAVDGLAEAARIAHLSCLTRRET